MAIGHACPHLSGGREIVGVVGDVKTLGLAVFPEPTFYLPYRQTEGLTQIALVVRSLDSGIIAVELRKRFASLVRINQSPAL